MFWVQRPAKLYNPSGSPLTENWTITAEESSGLSRGLAIQPYKAPTVDTAAENALRFDFGTTTSPVQKYGTSPEKSFLQVVPQTLYSATRGYGWMNRVAGADRRDNYTTYPGPSLTHDTASALRTDFNSGSKATFKADLPTGAYSVRIYHSNPLYFGSVPYTTQPFWVVVEGAPAYQVPAIAPGTTYIKELSGVSVAGGAIEIIFGWNGSVASNFMVAGIDISAGGLPTDIPLLATGSPLDEGAAAISMDMLQPVVAEAAARWSAAGLTPAQTATLSNVQFAVADLGGAYLGLANPATNTIRIDDDAAMLGWSSVTGHWSRGQWSVEQMGAEDNGQRTKDKWRHRSVHRGDARNGASAGLRAQRRRPRLDGAGVVGVTAPNFGRPGVSFP